MPPQPRRAAQDFDLGELARLISALTVTVDKLSDKVDGLGKEFTPREVHDLALGGIKIDIRRIDEQHGEDAKALRKTADELDRRLDEQEREVARRFRQSVLLIITAVVGPLTVALVIYILTSLAGTVPA